ncbi:queuosine precursor transporter [Flavobacterium sp. TP390]|uniref:Probable queuosine precursor transporter n=1 Tax=Flavobacterium profundi TaxID=1774945 RepID=A0A6I4IKR9_9FLAO|nr:queuosine precursor transporter [Flavobacterium profundi]MVO08791.1 queuosine precursor transporter [Flavobacterium profundi]
MSIQDKLLAQRIYLILASLFICSLVVSNLIFQKFFYWYPFGDVEIFGAKLFQISVGIIPYPITFLITDIISEIYGKKKANQVVTTGIFASVFSLGIIYVANLAPAIDNSPVTDALFTQVFGQTALAVIASMLAYLFAQYIDIQVYHFWKKLTKGKKLWVRNNFSTITSQAVDTFSVLLLLCSFKILTWDLFLPLFVSGFLFKVGVALLDTPFMYLAVYFFRKRFQLKMNEELSID